ncbi:hypothetical protein MASR2M44_09710 [Bacteroidota bacterium]
MYIVAMNQQLEELRQTLLKKSSVKQLAYRKTRDNFNLLRELASQTAHELSQLVSAEDPNVEVKFYEKSEFEFHLKFSGDTLVFMMHTNVFDFESSHFLHQLPYVQQNPLREFCGMIQIYNFLADSLKYNRESDLGYLVGRIFINSEEHLFVEGKRPLSFLYSDFSTCMASKELFSNLITESMKFCLNFDLQAPPVEAVSLLSVEQKNFMSFSSGIPTAKRLGFRMEKED